MGLNQSKIETNDCSEKALRALFGLLIICKYQSETRPGERRRRRRKRRSRKTGRQLHTRDTDPRRKGRTNKKNKKRRNK